MKDYHINISYCKDDEGYIADIPDLEAYSACGTTPAEALHEVQIAKEAWLETARITKKPIPAPKYLLLFIRRRGKDRFCSDADAFELTHE